MTLLAPLITGFLRDYMPRQRGYSSHSCEAYAYSFRLLFAFAAKRIRTRPGRYGLGGSSPTGEHRLKGTSQPRR